MEENGKIVHGMWGAVKLRLLSSPNLSSRVHWLTLAKIWGKNAGVVSAFLLEGMRLATRRPSGRAINAPSTPCREAALLTISLGVAYRFRNAVPGVAEVPVFLKTSGVSPGISSPFCKP